jgi:hypothetical protein
VRRPAWESRRVAALVARMATVERDHRVAKEEAASHRDPEIQVGVLSDLEVLGPWSDAIEGPATIDRGDRANGIDVRHCAPNPSTLPANRPAIEGQRPRGSAHAPAIGTPVVEWFAPSQPLLLDGRLFPWENRPVSLTN